ncbi:MAG TPA: hypothetical protein VLU47_01100 [Blastocatellia bacterium]|nr:hypothetical protein [Blastocatellia bacterium]
MNTTVSCKRTRELIDEADHPEALSFEASSHLESCPECGSFAEHRARLRNLLASGSRVGVPMNFDAVLKARLADAKSRSAFGWLNPAGYLKLGAATAGLVVVVIAAQYGGLFRSEQSAGEPRLAGAGNPAGTLPPQALLAKPSGVFGGPVAVAAGAVGSSARHHMRGIRGSARKAGAGVPLEIPGEDYLHLDGGVMLVRGPNGEADVSLPMVSVGAQSLIYASAGASPRSVRSVGTSF